MIKRLGGKLAGRARRIVDAVLPFRKLRRPFRHLVTGSGTSPPTQTRYRKAPDCFAESPNGIVYDFNGIDPVRRWDGITGATELAGVAAPITAPRVDGTGNGPIVGTFYAYVQFKDRYGNVSSVSPLSNQFLAQSIVPVKIIDASNASPIVIATDAAHGLSTNQTVKVDGIYGNENANNIWAVKVLTATTFQLVGSTASGFYNSGGILYTGVSSVVYSQIPVPTDAKVTKRRILRNRDGDLTTFYVDIETTDLTTTTFLSNNASSDFAGAESVPIVDLAGADLALHFYDPPPNDFAVAVTQGGRMFAAVTRPYSEGCVSVLSGSNVVTGIGTEWNITAFVNRIFNVVGDTAFYTVTAVASMTSLTLDRVYAGGNDPLARYSIAPDVTRRRAFQWSAAELPEAWPIQNTRQLPEDHGSGEPTGLLSQGAWVYMTCENWTMRFGWYRDPNTDGAFSLANARGCVNQRCCVTNGNVAYMMDYLGCHAFSGNNDYDISGPVGDIFLGQPFGPYQINWNARRFFHGVYNPQEGFLRWFVALDGDYLPRHALVCDPEMKRWSIEVYAFPIGASCLGQVAGDPQVFVGTSAKRMFVLNEGFSDGADSQKGTVRGTATSAGPGWIQDTTASFPAAWVGLPLAIVEGKGRGQQRLINAVTATRLTTKPWSIRPDNTSVYQVGGIPWAWRSGWLQWDDDQGALEREIQVLYNRTQAAAGFWAQVYDDSQTAALPAGATSAKNEFDGVGTTRDRPEMDILSTKPNGFARVKLKTARSRETDIPRFMALELDGVTNGERQSVWGVNIYGAEGI